METTTNTITLSISTVSASEGMKLVNRTEKNICSEIKAPSTSIDLILSKYEEISESEAIELQSKWDEEIASQNSTVSGE